MKRTPVRALRTKVARLLDALGHRIFREDDLHALARGWQIQRRRFRRTYRDPRWDLVVECSTCAGSGGQGLDLCHHCRGAGTIRKDLVIEQCSP